MNTTRKIMVLGTAFGSCARACYRSARKSPVVRPIRPATARFRTPEVVYSNLGPLPLAAPDEEFEKRRLNEIRRLIEHDKLVYTDELSIT